MTCTFRKARPEDFPILLENSTENGKVDQRVIDDSVDIRVMECDGVPIMAIGAIMYPGEDMIDTLGIWGIFSKDIKKHTKQAVRFCKDLIFDRVGTKFIVLIDERHKEFVRFIEFFGFRSMKVVEERDGILYHLYVKEN